MRLPLIWVGELCLFSNQIIGFFDQKTWLMVVLYNSHLSARDIMSCKTKTKNALQILKTSLVVPSLQEKSKQKTKKSPKTYEFLIWFVFFSTIAFS